MEGKLKYLRYIAYIVEILVLYVLSGTPGFMPSIMGVKPIILLPVALTIAVFEGEVPAMLYGALCGALCDIGSGTDLGLYTLTLTIMCFVLGYCASNFFVANFLNTSIIGVFCLAALFALHFFVFCVIPEVPDLREMFLRRYLIRYIYTLLFLFPLYWFNRLFHTTMKEG
ncbi:MAG: rod shape-determining protein MreD [Ruminococcus sp.]|nr:rod shape-determining protein MreD [Ruminococcus sp.]